MTIIVLCQKLLLTNINTRVNAALIELHCSRCVGRHGTNKLLDTASGPLAPTPVPTSYKKQGPRRSMTYNLLTNSTVWNKRYYRLIYLTNSHPYIKSTRLKSYTGTLLLNPSENALGYLALLPRLGAKRGRTREGEFRWTLSR